MNPLLIILLGWLMLGLESGLRDTLSVRIGGIVAAPSFVVPLAIFVALCAAPIPAMWTCLGLGLLLDLTSPQPTATGVLTVVGPNALGLLVAGQLVLLTRASVIRRHPLTLMVMSILGGAVAAIIVTAVFTFRGFMGDPVIFEPTSRLLGGLLSAVLTGGSGLALSLVFLPLTPLLGPLAPAPRFGRR